MVHVLLIVALGAAPAAKAGSPVISHAEAASAAAPVRVVTADDVAKLCRALEPTERLRAKGDAVERGEAVTRHDEERDAAIQGRYEVVVPAGAIAFAPYDGPERRLSLAEPAQIPVAEETARLWPTEKRGLGVEADAAAARRILDAQRAGSLSLALVFDVPDDATCGTDARGKKFTIPVEPVAWRWLDGEAVLAAGGSAAERPVVTAAAGAKPRAVVGDPLAGPAESKKAVESRRPDLEACYAEALRRDPSADGVVVAEIGGPKVAIAADSVGDAELAVCVQRALGTLPAGKDGRASVPIRFELAAPGAGEGR